MSYRNLLILSLPAMFAIGLEPVAELIDTIFLGQKNTLWVSGLGATNSVLISLTWVFNFLSYGVTGRIGRAFGSRDLNQVGSLLVTALMLSLLISVVISVPLLLSGNYILSEWYELKGQTLADARIYWDIKIFAYPLTFLAMTLVGILRGMQKIRETFWIVATNTFVNGVLTYWLVFPMDIGIQGAAIGTVCGFFLSVLLGSYFVYREVKKDSIPLSFKSNFSTLIDFGYDATNLFIRTGLLTLSFFLLAIAISKLGPLHLASHQILLQLWLLSAFVLDGLALTGTSYGARLLGQKKTAEYLELAKKLFVLGTLCPYGSLA